ncbi:MAG: NADP-dependent oxidoreductase [Solirubrobacterales bacterium]|nr:NADP-dependent oxidoreductase [Solirubrobacterales bacterium]
MTSTIRVCEVSEFGGPEVLRAVERPRPVARPGEVVVSIAAANINPTDLGARSGTVRRRAPNLQPPFVPGWDLAGVVSDLGEGVSRYAVGDRVVGMIPWIRIGGRVGAYAEAAAVDPDWLAPRPDGLDEVAGATVPLNTLTARQALDLIAAPPGATLLVTGASGAVGGFATQLAVKDGLRVVAVASDGDEDWVASLGAAEVVSRATDLGRLHPVDAVLDAVPVGGAAAAAARDGGVVVFTRRVGDVAGGRDLKVHSPLVHTDPVALASLTRMAASGALRTRVNRTLDLVDAAEAHRLVERGALRGKVVLTMNS